MTAIIANKKKTVERPGYQEGLTLLKGQLVFFYDDEERCYRWVQDVRYFENLDHYLTKYWQEAESIRKELQDWKLEEPITVLILS